MWLTHGLVLKLMTFGSAGLSGWLTTQGLPAALAWPLVLAEIGGGLLILLGVHGRWVSLALLPILVGATAIHAGNGWVFSAPNGGWEYPAFWTVTLVVQALIGNGAYALRSAGPAPVMQRA